MSFNIFTSKPAPTVNPQALVNNQVPEPTRKNDALDRNWHGIMQALRTRLSDKTSKYLHQKVFLDEFRLESSFFPTLVKKGYIERTELSPRANSFRLTQNFTNGMTADRLRKIYGDGLVEYRKLAKIKYAATKQQRELEALNTKAQMDLAEPVTPVVTTVVSTEALPQASTLMPPMVSAPTTVSPDQEYNVIWSSRGKTMGIQISIEGGTNEEENRAILRKGLDLLDLLS